jgi:hypothetical protein
MNRLERRIAALERIGTGAAPQLIRMLGGLHGGDPTHGTVDNQALLRATDETLAAFETRALVAAKAAGSIS